MVKLKQKYQHLSLIVWQTVISVLKTRNDKLSPRPTYLFTDKTVKLENYWDQSIIFRDPCTNINKIMLQKETERANELRLTFLRSKIILFIAICKIKILFIFCDPREI